MDKNTMIKYIEEYGTVSLIEKLINDGYNEDAMIIIQSLWCAEDESAIELINEFNF